MQASTFTALLAGGILVAGGILLGTHLEALRSDRRSSESRAADPADRSLRDRLAALEEHVGSIEARQRELDAQLKPAKELLDLLRQQVPNLRRARKSANETAAIATLRNLISAQAMIQQSGKIDLDEDGDGEYSGFLEMSGAARGRMYRALVPAVLSGTFRVLDDSGRVTRSGYHFHIYLPAREGRPVGEPPQGYTEACGVDADLCERVWCAYAWPVEERAGDKVFFTNQEGDVLCTVDARYRGAQGPRADAAFLEPGTITGKTAVERKGVDGNVWSTP